MQDLSYPKKSIYLADVVCLTSVVGLLIIFVLPETIALRHLLLVTGMLSSLAIIYRTQFFSGRQWRELTPLILLSSLFIWALVHFCFFSLNPALELKEIKSLWARSLMGVITAIGLSIILRLNVQLRPPFYIALLAVSLINLGAYFWMSANFWISYGFERLLTPKEFIQPFLFKKIEAAFFGVIAISIACANIIYLTSKVFDTRRLLYIFFWIIGITVAGLSSLVANSKNGIASALILCLLMALILVYLAIYQKESTKTNTTILALIIIVLTFGGWKLHIQSASQGWGSLLDDIKISSKIDQHNFWRFNGQHWNKVIGEEIPKNSKGETVAGNTYERVAWAVMGLRLIAQHPMGYGSINQSFVGLLDHAKIKQELESQTHSGWIDFGLAFGLPGLLILFLTFASIVFFGLVKRDQFGLIGAWLAIGLMPFGLIAEISYKHNFEILLFFISFAAASTISIKNANGLSNP
jgi:hypothetical protein